MPTITEQKVKRSALELEKLIKQARRKLFEFETLSHALAIKKGNFEERKTPKEFFKYLDKIK